jgi:uncharacterized protein (DUF608 family)
MAQTQVVKMSAPADKGFDAAYFARLREKGEPMRAKGEALKWIGMPIGGICTGQLYLSGDGQLWHWDIFNQPPDRATQNGPTYEHPLVPDVEKSPLKFYLACDGGEVFQLSQATFPETEWTGQWPIGRVAYRGGSSSVEVDLEVFSPFAPLDEDASGMPATCFVFRIHNPGDEAVAVDIVGAIDNVILQWSGQNLPGTRRAMPIDSGRWVGVILDASVSHPRESETGEDLMVEDWSNGYAKWTSVGTAFGSEPLVVASMPSYQGDIGATTAHVVNSHNTRQGEDVAGGDAHVGRLIGSPFVIERRHLSFLIGGGNHPDKTCLNLKVDGHVVRTQTGADSNHMTWQSWNVEDLQGKSGVLEIVDDVRGAWGNIGVGEIVQSDAPKAKPVIPEQQGDWGTMCLLCDSVVTPPASGRANLGETLSSTVIGRTKISSGGTAEIRFVLAWHFPNPWRESLSALKDSATLRRWYATKWSNAASVAVDAATNFSRLCGETKAWNRTWYGGSLPYWFLERTLIPAGALASATCYRFDNDRFYGWEGNYCCAGTCTHVWGYAQSSGFLFPGLERGLRTNIDFGQSWKEDGSVDYRGEYGKYVAHDGQCTMILRTMREHLNSEDNQFLTPIWPRVRKSIERLIADDKDRDGMLEGAQYNTLDATWYGPMGWISSLYVAALAVGERMARDMGDTEFAQTCRSLADRGKTRIGETLFNGEYFIHKPDPAHPEANSTNDGCHIDQVFGASWLRQMGMDGEIEQAKVRSALQSIWKYSFLPDVGPYRRDMKVVEGGRWYAMPGEAGLLMCSWPRGGAEHAVGKGGEAWAAGYFNECMNGFEWQVAAHMLAEDMVDEGLAVVRALHDRYAPAKRNPYNEIECGDHYARSMASHGAYLTACGFQHDGPRGIIGFNPKVNPEDFSCAWTASESWGRYRQKRVDGKWTAALSPVSGPLTLNQLLCNLKPAGSVKVTHLKREIDCQVTAAGIAFAEPIVIPAGTTLRLTEV